MNREKKNGENYEMMKRDMEEDGETREGSSLMRHNQSIWNKFGTCAN